MSLADLIRKGGLRELVEKQKADATLKAAGLATATLATPATRGAEKAGNGPPSPSTVATVATVAVATATASKVETANQPDWRALHAEYLEHHWTCETCIAGGQGRGLRCGTGAALWTAYGDAP